jgi:hypothetical protein
MRDNDTAPVVAAAQVATTLSGGYRLDRSYRVGGPAGVTIEVTVIREPSVRGSMANATLPSWDRHGKPLPGELAWLPPDRWYWGTTDNPSDVVASLGAVADLVLRQACLRLRVLT